MPRREKEPISRHHFWIYQRDYTRLKEFFENSIGMSNAVRQILRNYLNRMESKAEAIARHPIAMAEVDFREVEDDEQ